MATKKFNAALSLLTTLLLFVHAISIAAWMLSRGAIGRLPALMSWGLAACMLLHMFISVEVLIARLIGEEPHKGKMYPKANRVAIVQRASGVLLFVTTIPHVLGTLGLVTPPPAVHAILPPLFFIVAMVHTAVSFSRALITLGIGTAKVIKAADIAAKVICAATLAADIVGFYLFVV